MSMDKYFAKSQLAKIALIVAFLLVVPLLSTSMRPPFLYILFNLLIILLGAESGVLRGFSSPPDDKKPAAALSPASAPAEADSNKSGEQATTRGEGSNKGEEKNAAAAKLPRVKKCPSIPRLFFIGGGEAEQFKEEDDDGGDELEEEGKELFAKAEMFIGNFYKQLKMQREESWKKIHGLYQKAF